MACEYFQSTVLPNKPWFVADSVTGELMCNRDTGNVLEFETSKDALKVFPVATLSLEMG